MHSIYIRKHVIFLPIAILIFTYEFLSHERFDQLNINQFVKTLYDSMNHCLNSFKQFLVNLFSKLMVVIKQN